MDFHTINRDDISEFDNEVNHWLRNGYEVINTQAIWDYRYNNNSHPTEGMIRYIAFMLKKD